MTNLGGILLLKAVMRPQHEGLHFRRFTGWWCQIFHEYNLKGLEFVATLVLRVPGSTQVLTEGKAQFFVLLGPQAAHEFTPSSVRIQSRDVFRMHSGKSILNIVLLAFFRKHLCPCSLLFLGGPFGFTALKQIHLFATDELAGYRMPTTILDGIR